MKTSDVVKLLDEVTSEREGLYSEVIGELSKYHIDLMSRLFFDLERRSRHLDLSNDDLRFIALFVANKAFESCCGQICNSVRFR